MIKISFVVTVYNKEKTLERCLESIINQTYDNYEIIIIDDGSTDSSSDIIKRYKENEKIKVIYNSHNIGLGSSRYVGMDNADGEYVVYVDADDVITDDYAQLLHDKIRHESYDIVYVKINVEQKDGSVKTKGINSNYYEGRMNKEKCEKMILQPIVAGISGFAFRRKCFAKQRKWFMEGINFDEDIIAIFYPFWVNSIGIIDKPVYCWKYDHFSMSKKTRNRYKDRLSACSYLYHYVKSIGKLEEYYLIVEFIVTYYYYLNTIREILRGKEYVSLPVNILNKCRRTMKKYFPNYKKNKYLLAELNLLKEEKFLKLMEANDISAACFEKAYYGEYREFYVSKEGKIKQLLDELEQKRMKVAIWGAGLKGKTFLYYMDKEGKYIQYVIDGDKALRGREIDEYHKIYTYEDVIDLVDVILIMNTRHYNSIQEKVNTEIKIIDMDQYIDSENEVKNII